MKLVNSVNCLDNSVGYVYRHNRLFNYLASPLSIDSGLVKCQVGKNSYRDMPIDYFKRDWHKDTDIDYADLLSKINEYPDKTPFTTVYNDIYEIDDGLPHSYIHFDDDMNEKVIRFPSWKLTTCTKTERNSIINPYTLIMPVKDGITEEIQKELDIFNEIRKENEFIHIDDFQGFEFGLIKVLETKYLRVI